MIELDWPPFNPSDPHWHAEKVFGRTIYSLKVENPESAVETSWIVDQDHRIPAERSRLYRDPTGFMRKIEELSYPAELNSPTQTRCTIWKMGDHLEESLTLHEPGHLWRDIKLGEGKGIPTEVEILYVSERISELKFTDHQKETDQIFQTTLNFAGLQNGIVDYSLSYDVIPIPAHFPELLEEAMSGKTVSLTFDADSFEKGTLTEGRAALGNEFDIFKHIFYVVDYSSPDTLLVRSRMRLNSGVRETTISLTVTVPEKDRLLRQACSFRDLGWRDVLDHVPLGFSSRIIP